MIGPTRDSKHWRDRAAEMRVLGEEMKEVETKKVMCQLADDYDLMADRAEERAKPRPEGKA